MTIVRFVNKKGILNFISGKVDPFTYLQYFVKPLKNPDECNHIDIDEYNSYDLLCLDCGMIIEAIQ